MGIIFNGTYLFSLNFQTKAAWGEKISTARIKNGPYTALRARMTVRKMLGHEPTEDQVKEEAHQIRKREKHNSSNGLTSADVIAAFERGEEVSPRLCLM